MEDKNIGTHGENCGCGHNHGEQAHQEHAHGENCGCGHNHGEQAHQEHAHGENCGCGHSHGEQAHQEHAHGENCGCGHDHGEQAHQEHAHGENCGCGHDHGEQAHQEHAHGENCGCGHSHGEQAHQEHAHGENCGCGHSHGEHAHQERAHDENCGCGHSHGEHAHQEHAQVQAASASGKFTQIYVVENLGCANCAAKMERKIGELAGVKSATLTFATKQLRVVSDKNIDFQTQLQTICSSIESEVKVVKKERKQAQKKKSYRELYEIIFGALLFIFGSIIADKSATASIIIFVVAYVVLGREIVWTAVKNLFKGHIFDENFLMTIATLGAFAIREYPEAVGVMLFYRVGEYFEHVAVEKSRNQIMDAVDMRPETVELLSGESTQTIAAEDAKAGDILLVRPGDRIPLDGVVVSGESRIDTSPVTGEPVPVKVQSGSEVISGCVNTSGVLQMRVTKILEESMVTRILNSVENAAASKPQIDRFITKFARIYTPIVVLVAALTAVVPSIITGDWNHWIYTALTFLVISCPCALVLSVPLSFFAGIGAGSKKGILFKGGVSLEAMRKIRAVVMDKTGTITHGNFTVQSCQTADGVLQSELIAIAAACEKSSTHPIATSIVAYAIENNIEFATPDSLQEIAGKGIKAQISGCEILCGNAKLLEENGVIIGNDGQKSAGTEVILAKNGVYIGKIEINDTIKADAAPAIAQIKKQGIITAMLTGDAQASADEVGRKTGVDEVHAKLLPDEKLAELQNIRKKHGAVMFVGDGINDAPVLAGADVGAAMGSGADAAIEAADVVFMTSSMSAIPEALSIARQTGRISWQNVVFALAVKAIVMVLGFAGIASMWMAVFADTGVAMLCVLNSIRLLYRK